MLARAASSAVPFAACARLFARFPLAVTARGGSESMVLASRVAGAEGVFVLRHVRNDLFVIRSWSDDDSLREEIRPGEPVTVAVSRALADGVPVPRDGALLGWVTDRSVTALLVVRCGRPGTDPPPEVLVLPMAGTAVVPEWPPFTSGPLGDWSLWENVELGVVVDVLPLVARNPGHVFWAPSPAGSAGSAGHAQHSVSARRPKGCVVVTASLVDEEYWLPAGTYFDHWTLREGLPVPPRSWLLAWPGVSDLAGARPASEGRPASGGRGPAPRSGP